MKKLRSYILLAITALYISLNITNPSLATVNPKYLPWDPGVEMKYTTYPGHRGLDFPLEGRNINARVYQNGVIHSIRYGEGSNGLCPLIGRKNEGFGNVVRVSHADGTYSIYAHLASVNSSLSPGQPVQAGTIVGKIGNTGCSDGPHLHFQISYDPYGGTSGQNPIFIEAPNGLSVNQRYISQNTGQSTTLESAIKGRVSVHRGGNSELYVSWDKNTGVWQNPPAKITGPYGPSKTQHSPVAVYDKYGKLNVFHVGLSGHVYQQILEGNRWQTINTGLVTIAQPEVVLHEGYLNIYARGARSQLLHVSSDDNRRWGQVGTIPTTFPVYGKPSAAVRGREILVAYPTTGNQIAAHYSATGQGYANRVVPGLRTRREIGLVSYHGRFVMVHVGDNLKGYLNFTENAVNWSSARQIPYSTFTIGIDLNVSNHLIHLSHGGQDGQIYYQSSDTHEGTRWSSPRRQHHLHSTPNPVALTGK